MQSLFICRLNTAGDGSKIVFEAGDCAVHLVKIPPSSSSSSSSSSSFSFSISPSSLLGIMMSVAIHPLQFIVTAAYILQVTMVLSWQLAGVTVTSGCSLDQLTGQLVCGSWTNPSNQCSPSLPLHTTSRNPQTLHYR